MYELDFDILVEYANDLGVASRSYVRQCQSNGWKPEAVYGRLCKNKTLVDLVDTGLYATVVFSILNTFYPNGSAYEVLKLLLFPENISTHLDKYATYAQLDSKEAAILYAHIMRFNLLLGKVDETYNSDVDKLLGIHVSDNTADGVMNKVDRELGELHGRHLVTAVLTVHRVDTTEVITTEVRYWKSASLAKRTGMAETIREILSEYIEDIDSAKECLARIMKVKAGVVDD